jgi:hypothetical protein
MVTFLTQNEYIGQIKRGAVICSGNGIGLFGFFRYDNCESLVDNGDQICQALYRVYSSAVAQATTWVSLILTLPSSEISNKVRLYKSLRRKRRFDSLFAGRFWELPESDKRPTGVFSSIMAGLSGKPVIVHNRDGTYGVQCPNMKKKVLLKSKKVLSDGAAELACPVVAEIYELANRYTA